MFHLKFLSLEQMARGFYGADFIYIQISLIISGSHVWHYGPVWAREHCRISPPRFLAECRKRRLNQGTLVLLYFRLFELFFVVIFDPFNTGPFTNILVTSLL